jgi:hypothetical protein
MPRGVVGLASDLRARLPEAGAARRLEVRDA